jgi:opacity protein-like surface antigen
MRTLVQKTVLSTLLFGLIVLASATARSEFYVAGQGGISLPGSFSDVQGIGQRFGGAGFKSSDLDLATSPLYGAKVGYFFPGLNWLGFEGEYFYTNPHIKQQPFSVTTPSGQKFDRIGDKPGAHTRMSTAALNIIVRYPGKRFQPYIGVGPAMYWARIAGSEIQTINNQPLSASDSSLGLNVLVGARFFLTKHIAFFGEYKYNRASFEFTSNAQFKTDYSANNLAVGVAVHF